MDNKRFLTYDEQVNKLKKRGLLINKSDKEHLMFKNYYTLINGYKSLFLKDKKKEIYKEGADINEIVTLYEFDRKLRHIILEYILIFEQKLKSKIAYEFSKSYNYKFSYLYDHNYSDKTSKKVVKKLKKKMINEINNKNNKNIVHYIEKHKNVPLWVLIGSLSFGTVSKMYHALNSKEKIRISNDIIPNLGYNKFDKFVKHLVFFRNAAAHFNRFYEKKYRTNLIPIVKTHRNLNLQKNIGRNDIFSIIIILKNSLNNNHFNELINGLEDIINELKKELNTISYNEILIIMGFPPYWENIKQL